MQEEEGMKEEEEEKEEKENFQQAAWLWCGQGIARENMVGSQRLAPEGLEPGGNLGVDSKCSWIHRNGPKALWEAALHSHLYPHPHSLQARSSTRQEDLPATIKDLTDGKFVLDLLALPCVIIGVLIKTKQNNKTKLRVQVRKGVVTEGRAGVMEGGDLRAKGCR